VLRFSLLLLGILLIFQIKSKSSVEFSAESLTKLRPDQALRLPQIRFSSVRWNPGVAKSGTMYWKGREVEVVEYEFVPNSRFWIKWRDKNPEHVYEEEWLVSENWEETGGRRIQTGSKIHWKTRIKPEPKFYFQWQAGLFWEDALHRDWESIQKNF